MEGKLYSKDRTLFHLTSTPLQAVPVLLTKTPALSKRQNAERPDPSLQLPAVISVHVE